MACGYSQDYSSETKFSNSESIFVWCIYKILIFYPELFNDFLWYFIKCCYYFWRIPKIINIETSWTMIMYVTDEWIRLYHVTSYLLISNVPMIFLINGRTQDLIMNTLYTSVYNMKLQYWGLNCTVDAIQGKSLRSCNKL